MIVALSGSGILAGCDRDEPIGSYPAPKETQDKPRALVSAEEAQQPDLPVWTAPKSWKALPIGPSEMRYAAYAANDDDPPLLLTVVPLGAAGGAVLPNVNRWREQLGLAAIQEADLSKVTRQAGEATVVDLVGPETPPAGGPRQRMLAAILPHGPMVWFFKMAGAADKVGQQAESFDQFIRSVHFGHPAKAPAAPKAEARLDQWTAPPGWKRDEQAQPPRMLAFAAGEGADAAEVAVIKFAANNFGDMAANINRWRGQVGLEPLADTNAYKPEKIAVAGNEGLLIDLTGPEAAGAKPQRMLIAMAAVGEEVWFFKVTGPAAAVAAQKPAFEAFLKSVRFATQPAK